MEAPRLFSRPRGPHCDGCRLLDVCGSDRTDNACTPELDLGGAAGPFVLHPLRTDFDVYFDRVGGVLFDDVRGRPVAAASFGAYLPQVKWLERLKRERLSAAEVPVVAVRLKEVFRGGRIRSAQELRSKTGLSADVAIVLLLHGNDRLLERLDDGDLTEQIAAGGYALVTPPSFSLWEPQRRPDNLLSLRRSFLSYDALVEAGTVACPRVGWVEQTDAERLAAWINRYEITLVSVDLMTYASRSFDRAVASLARFDELTDRRLSYLVDGVRAQSKIEALYFAAAAERVTVSSATMTGPAPIVNGTAADTLLSRAGFVTARCRRAAENVDAAHASSIEAFIAETVSLPARQPASRSFLTAASRGAR